MHDSEGEFEPWPYRDAVDVLVAHHRKVGAELARLRGLDVIAERDTGALQEAAEVATTALDVFGRDGCLHSFDEDAVLFPRLKGELGGGHDGLLEALARVQEEHAVFAPLWDRLERCLTPLSLPDAPVSLRDLREARLALEACVVPHLRFEERFVYPAARRLLGPAIQLEMMGTMRAHRSRPGSGTFRAVP